MEDSNKNINVAEIDDFDKLLEAVRSDSSLIDNLTDEQVTNLRKKLNPYGRTVEGSGALTCLSITNLSEQYMKKFLMTSMIGFLYRQCDEYCLDDGEPTCPMDDYNKFIEKYNEAVEKGKQSKEWLNNFNQENTDEYALTMEQKAERLTHIRTVERGEGFSKRLIVRQFIDNLFQYNPDLHVRSAYSNNPLDPERVVPKQIKTKKIVGKSGEKITIKQEQEQEQKEKRENSHFVKHIPPSDTFHRLNYYIDTNYEEIRTAVQDLYCEKPDLEFAINPYDKFSSQEEADKFIQKHKNEVIADVITLTNGKWNLCGSFKNNRDRINFYNEKTAVIEEIFKQIEQDKKLGADLMRKRVKSKKEKNIKEYGPDPDALKGYKKANRSGFESLGAEDVLKEEKRDVDEDKQTFSMHEDCPYDAVQVDVFDIRGGGSTVDKTRFFTAAEDPKEINKP